MANPPLPIGTAGEISAVKNSKSGRWRARCRFRDLDGETREVSASGLTRNAAIRDLKEKCAERVRANGSDEITGDTTVAALAEFWMTTLVGDGTEREDTTLAEYRRVIANAIVPAIGGMRLRELSASRLDRMLLALPTNSRRKKVRTVLTRMIDLAVRHDAMLANPMSSVTRTPYSPGAVREVPIEDLDTIRGLIRDWINRDRPGPRSSSDLADIFDLMMATGLRIGEILALRWSDIELSSDAPCLHVNGTIKTVPGKGTYRKPRPKTDSGVRTIRIPQFAVSMLRRRFLAQGPNELDAVFVTRNDTWHSVTNIERRWREAREGTGFEWVTPHAFRKTVATLIDRETDAETAARQLGHSSKDVTEAHYINRAPTTVDVADVIQQHLAPRHKAV